MKRMSAVLASVFLTTALLLVIAAPQAHALVYNFDFETGWSGDYAPGWQNTAYRHGTAPVAQMMQQTTTAHSGTYGLKLIASDPLGLFWVGVNPTAIPVSALDKQYNPYIKAWYYEENKTAVAGQIFAVPDSPIADVDDWTDVQFGGRRQPANGANFNYIAVTMTGPNSWVDTGVARSGGWHELMMQLSSADGKIYFYLDGSLVGSTVRDDYTNLGTIGLYTMFDAASLGTSGIGSSTIWDDVRIGSSVPIPGAVWLLGSGIVGLIGLKRRKTVKG